MKYFVDINIGAYLSILFFGVLSCQPKAAKDLQVLNTHTMELTLDQFIASRSNVASAYVGHPVGARFVKVNRSDWPNITSDNAVFIRRADDRWYGRQEFVERRIVRPEWFGAVGDGRTNDHAAFMASIAYCLDHKAALETSPKQYHIASSLEISGRKAKGMRWHGNGATLDNTILLGGLEMTIRDLIVDGSPEHGFIWSRGQGGFFANLTARNCVETGFLIGGAANRQIGWSTFVNLTAVSNRIGFHLDGSHAKNWANANIFSGCFARGNLTYGVVLAGKANYNTWQGLHCEGNNKSGTLLPAMLLDRASENMFSGGHLVTGKTNPSSVVVDTGRQNTFVGGRYVANNPDAPSVIDSPRGNAEMAHRVKRRTQNPNR